MNNRTLGIFFIVLLVGCHLNGWNGRRTIEMEQPKQINKKAFIKEIRTLRQNSSSLLETSKKAIERAYDLNQILEKQEAGLSKIIMKTEEGIRFFDFYIITEGELRSQLEENLRQLKNVHKHIKFLSKRCEFIEKIQNEINKIIRGAPGQSQILRPLQELVLDLKREYKLKMQAFKEEAGRMRLTVKEPDKLFTRFFGRTYLSKKGKEFVDGAFGRLKKRLSNLHNLASSGYPHSVALEKIGEKLQKVYGDLYKKGALKSRISKQDYEKIKESLNIIRHGLAEQEESIRSWEKIKGLVTQYKELKERYKDFSSRGRDYYSRLFGPISVGLQSFEKIGKKLQMVESRLYVGEVPKKSISDRDYEVIKLLLSAIKKDLELFEEKIKEKREEEYEKAEKTAKKRREELAKEAIRKREKTEREQEVQEMRKRRKEQQR